MVYGRCQTSRSSNRIENRKKREKKPKQKQETFIATTSLILMLFTTNLLTRPESWQSNR